VRQKKTERPVKFELTDQTRRAEYLNAANKKPSEFLFIGRKDNGQPMTTRQYARLLSERAQRSERQLWSEVDIGVIRAFAPKR